MGKSCKCPLMANDCCRNEQWQFVLCTTEHLPHVIQIEWDLCLPAKVGVPSTGHVFDTEKWVGAGYWVRARARVCVWKERPETDPSGHLKSGGGDDLCSPYTDVLVKPFKQAYIHVLFV